MTSLELPVSYTSNTVLKNAMMSKEVISDMGNNEETGINREIWNAYAMNRKRVGPTG